MKSNHPNIRYTRGINKGVHTRSSSRPGSAKELYEVCSSRKNEEYWKLQEWQDTVDNFKKRQWECQFYNALVENKKSWEDDWKVQKEKNKRLIERRHRLYDLFEADEDRYKEERNQLKEQIKPHISNTFYPELALLKSKLEEAKRRNAEERKKMSEALSHEAWKKSSSTVRQMESDRLNHFVQEAWIDQKQWKEDERMRQEEKNRKAAFESANEERMQEELYNQREEERKKDLNKWKAELDLQIHQIEEKNREKSSLVFLENELVKEKSELEKIENRRKHVLEVRKRKELEQFWARQFHLKLKKKSAAVQMEITEDEGILEDVLHAVSPVSTEEKIEKRRDEAAWMKKVLFEQQKLERLREKEHELLFSEEAKLMWQKRELEWEREQKARNKLMSEVLTGLKEQIAEKLKETTDRLLEIENEKETLKSEADNARHFIIDCEKQEISGQVKSPPVKGSVEENVLNSDLNGLRNQRTTTESELKYYQTEISRLEEELKKLWAPLYVPPHHGRKKVIW